MECIEKTADTMEYASHDSCKLLYDRIRVVNINCQEFMSYSCIKVQMFLMTCRHIYVVIEDKVLYVPSLFHICWHKLFYNYHGNSF